MTEQTPPPPPPGSTRAPGQDEPWAARFGLVRPRHGRLVAGVCAGIGRVTGTDPLLWRVLIGVLSIFGVGVILYLAAWLLTPAEGDTASPVEALLGRGMSSTSTGLTMIIGVVVVICLGAITNSWHVPVAAIVALVIVALANSRPRGVPPVPATVPGPDPATEPLPVGTPVAPEAAGYPPPVAGYQPPFAPHGPYASGPPLPPAVPKPPKPRREKSKLGRLIMGILLIVLGVLGLADLAGASVPFVAYLATGLGVIGIGLLIGAWFGRARGFIVIGLAVALLLPIALDESTRDRSHGPQRWTPVTVEEIAPHYDSQFGDVVLDFSEVDFTGQRKEVLIELSAGSLELILPPEVDATVDARVQIGDATIFGRGMSGTSLNRIERDLGYDGPGGGEIIITLNVRAGTAEVSR
jgi:phage shock protein PspC (stress-responsive transcriptional regulator)